MKCSNCTSDAMYALTPERVSPVYYCGIHLPVFLQSAASKGLLDLPIAPTKGKSAPKPEPVVVEEEPVVEETPAEPETEELESDEE